MAVINLDIPDKLTFLYTEKSRYKVLYGGRGSGKSWGIGDALIILCRQKKMRILCTRQLQTSIKDSVHKLLCDTIDKLGLTNDFIITKDSIRCKNGSEFIFKGIQNNVNEIKSIEGIDICWVEEASSVSQDSWDILIPTIRKEGSEIWVSFNPDRDEDATYQMFVKNKLDDCISVEVNYTDNPFFPEVLRREMEWCKKVDFGKYEHVWLGKTVINTEAQVYKGKFELKDFEAPEDTTFYYGADWGFACLVGNTLVTTDKGDVFIKDIKVGDRVLTRDGYKKVLFTKNKGLKKVYDVDFGYKKHIIATEDHRIFTYDGWKRVDELKNREKICAIKSNSMEEFINGIQMASTLITSIIKIERKIEYIIGICGNIIKGLFQKIMLSTTWILTHLTIVLKTLFALLPLNILKYTINIIWEKSLKKECNKSEQKMDIQKKIGEKEERKHWKLLKKGVEFVRNVVRNLSLQTFIKNFVVRNVERNQTQEIHKKNIFANIVEKVLLRHRIAKEKLVQMNVPINLTLRKEKEEVYDITVENGEFFANGVLVHNCDPTALIRCFIKDRSLYIDYESGGVGVDFDDIPALFDVVPDSRKWVIRADCARPETISYMNRKGFIVESCPKWKGSIEDGISYIRGFEKIFIHPRCKNTYNEFKFYSYKQDRITGDVLPIVLDKDNHYLDALRYALNPYIQTEVSILDVL